MIDDEVLPAAATLVSDDAIALLATAVDAAGGRLDAARRDQVLYRPGTEMRVRYSTSVSWRGSAPVSETLVAVARVDGPPEGALRLEADDMAVGVWRYPYDPELPGLGTAVVPALARELLDTMLEGPIELHVRVYRPGRRAVVEVTGASGRVFLKVLPPAKAAALAARHRRLSGILPVPAVLDVHEPLGIVVLEGIEGESLRERLSQGRGRLPRGVELLELLDGLERVDFSETPARPSPLSVVPTHVELLARLLPEERARLDEDLDRLGDNSPQPAAAVHGDLHEAQLIVGGDGTIRGLLDIDGAGIGARIDDLATLLGHLATLARTYPDQSARVHAYAGTLERRFAASVDPEELRRRTSAAVLGLATGPFRVQLPAWELETRRRISLARRLLDGCARRRAA